MDGGRPHENNYELVYSAWRHQQRLTGHEEAQRLNALRPSLQQLRRSYRNDSVRVEYGGAIAEAYLLAYVPLTSTKPKKCCAKQSTKRLSLRAMSFGSDFSVLDQDRS